MKIWFDFEFTGLHQHTTPISLGIVSETGRTFYAEFTDYDRGQIDSWLEENVLAHLVYQGDSEPPKQTAADRMEKREVKGTKEEVTLELTGWLHQFNSVEVWSDCLAYDWVLFCELFGGARKLPEHIYYIPFDLSTLLLTKGVDPDIDRAAFASLQHLAKHHALHDAWIQKECTELLLDGYKGE